MVMVTAYVGLLLAQLPDIPGTGIRAAADAGQARIQALLRPMWDWPGITRLTYFHHHGLYLLVVGLAVPWLVTASLGARRPRDIGLRIPNRLAVRVLAVGLAVSLPLLWWMAHSPGIAENYARQFRPTATPAVLYYAVNMTVEHILLQGLVLALFRPGLRWPEPPGLVEGGAPRGLRALRWLGLAQPTEGATGLGRARAWLGLPPDCVPAVLMSGVLFGMVHFGKDTRELLLSFPGGVVSAYVAYRTNSLLTPFVLHLLTALAALGMMLALVPTK
jgi:hypothetical protein